MPRAPRTARVRSFVVQLAAGAALGVLGACGSSTTTPTTSTTVGPVASITISPAGATMTIGDTARFAASIFDANKNTITTDVVTWKSSAPSVATISDSGTVDALSAGTAEIIATDGTVADSVALTVQPPATVALAGLTGLAAGFSNTCAVAAAGVVECWGANAAGQLGNDTTTISPLPLAISGGLSFAKLAAGYSHVCGLTAAGTAYCWGADASGELGNGTISDSSAAPVAVSGGLTFASLSAGYSHTCGVTAAGAAYCWGADESGELGNGTVGQNSAVPVPVSGGLTFASISAGGVYSCGVTTAGAGYCWGGSAYGVLGDGSGNDSPVPVAVAGGLKLASISAGVYHTCAVTTDGAAYCWGNGANGQLGIGITSLSSNTPLAVTGGHTFASITTGELNSCALTAGGTAYCWGAGSFGDLGAGSTAQANAPQLVSGGYTFAALSAGLSFHVCGMTTDGGAYCWGYNNSGELGNANAGGYSTTPARVMVRNH